MKKKGIIAVIAALAISIPALAVFNEKDLGQTISVLRFELKAEYDKLTAREERLNSRNDGRRRQMINLMKKCNELSLMLYSQNQDFTFDHTYALGEVTKQYESFSKTRLPFDDMVVKLDLEIDRHERLIESLRRLPPQLEEIEEVPDSIVREIGGPSFQTRRLPRRPPQGFQMPQMDSARRAELEKERRTFVLDSLREGDSGFRTLYRDERTPQEQLRLCPEQISPHPETHLRRGSGRLFHRTQELRFVCPQSMAGCSPEICPYRGEE